MAFLKELCKIEACITGTFYTILSLSPTFSLQSTQSVNKLIFLNHNHGWIMYIVNNGLT
jgi:hypothetical protein